MVDKKEVKDLATLSRMEISDSEAENLAPELDSILTYVGKIQEVLDNNSIPEYSVKNVFREDEVINQDDFYTEEILNNAPKREGRYVKVKKIL